ncbi:phage portal protein family protein [Spirosoma lituiforme]
MVKKKVNPKPDSVVINDFGINIRTVDRSRMDMQRWRQALVSAESILQPTRNLLYDLYDDATLDEHLTSVLEQRRLAITNTRLVFKKDGEVVDDIQNLIDTEGFEDLVTYLLDSRFYGYSLCYADLAAKNELGEPDPVVELVPRKHVVPSRTLVVADPYSIVGVDYTQPPYNHLYVAAGKPKNLGLLLQAAILVLIKRADVSDWATFNEVFGQPMRVAYYTTGDPTQKQQLESAMANAGAMSYLVLPDGSKIEFPEVNKTGSADTYERLQKAMDGGMSKLIVGQTMTTEDGSSKSQGEVHERVAEKIARSDRRFILKLLNSRVKALLAAQGFSVDGKFDFEEEQEKVSIKDQIANAINVHTKVAPIKLDWWMERFGFPFDEEEIERRQQLASAITEPDEEDPEPEKPKKSAKKKPAGKQNNATETDEGLLERARALMIKLFGIDPFANFH